MMQTASSPHLRLLPCRQSGIPFCLDTVSLRGIARADLVEHHPDGDPFGEGPFGWLPGEEKIPVETLAAVFSSGVETPFEPTQRPSLASGRILILESPTGRWALLVENVARIFETEPERVHPFPSVARDDSNRFHGVVIHDGQLHLFLDPEVVRHRRAGAATGPAAAAPGQGGSRPEPELRDTTAVVKRRAGAGRIVSFSTSGPNQRPFRYAISITQVAEVLPPQPFLSVPGAPSWVVGLINWRERPVAMVDLDRRLALASHADFERVMVVRTGREDAFLALPVLRDLRVLSLPVEHRPAQGEFPVESTLVRGIFELGGETLVIPDLAGIAGAAARSAT